MAKRRGSPILPQAPDGFGPVGKSVPGLRPMRHASFVSPFGKMWHGRAVGAAGGVGAHRVLVSPAGHGPERLIVIALDRAPQEAFGPTDLGDRAVGVNHEEGEETH